MNFIEIIMNTMGFLQTKMQQLIQSLAKFFMLILLVFQEIKPLLISVLILIAIDQFTGVWKAIYLKEFNWKKFYRLYSKTILYLVVIMSTFLYEEFLVGEVNHYGTRGISAIIGFQELSSIYLNITVITGKTYINDFLKTFKKKLKK